MKLEDGKLVVTEEERNILASEEAKAFAKEIGLVEVKEVIKEAELTDDKVHEYLKTHQPLMDKIGNNIRTSFLAKKLGKDEKEVNDLLGKDIVLKDEYEGLKKQAIDTAIKYRLQGTKYPELLESKISRESLKFENGNIDGLDDAVTKLQEQYPDLFGTGEKTFKTPAPLPKGDEPKKLDYETFEKMTEQERAQLTEEQLKSLLK